MSSVRLVQLVLDRVFKLGQDCIYQRRRVVLATKLMKTSRRFLIRCSCVGIFVLLGSVPAWCSKTRGGSDYGVTPLTTCGPAAGPFNGVSATCYIGGGGFPNDFLFNFTLANPSPSTSVTSFTINFEGTAPSDFGLVVGPCPGGVPVPCAANFTTANPPPFDVNGTLGTGNDVFNFTDFTGDQSGQVTVFFSYDAQSPMPNITDITTTAGTTTPEPSTVFLLLAGIALALGVPKIRWSRQEPS